MRKSLKIIPILGCIILILGIILIQIIYNFKKNSNAALVLIAKDSKIENLESTIKKLEEKNEFLSKELKTTQLRFENELASKKFQNEKEKIIEDTFEWILDNNWNKVTLTNSSGTTIDITNSDVIKYHFINSGLIRTFKFEFSLISQISKTYTYTFYFDDFTKEVTLSNGGFVHDVSLCRNTYLYDVAEALLPSQDGLNDAIYTAKQMLLDSKFFSYKQESEFEFIIPYLQIRYLILEWLPKHTIKIDKLPDNVNKPTLNIECFYRGKKAYLKTYIYDNIADYYIELSNDVNTEVYKLIDIEPPISIRNIFSSGIE